VPEPISARIAEGVASIPAAHWDACAGDGNPFLSHAFLSALEASGSVGAGTGWQSLPVVIEDADGIPAAIAPAYAKSHSQGEYVFDHAWADAWERAGGRYYPKLLGAVPFTPVTGPRFLIHPDADPSTVRQALIQGAETLCARLDLSSVHVNFPTETEWREMAAAGWLPRLDLQYVFTDQGYGDFEGFLAALSSNRRKTIRRERREAQAGLDIRILTGAGLTEDVWDAFFAFYLDTGSRKWGRPYLTRDFFARIGRTMANRIALVMAYRGETPIAGALNFIGRDALYGRQWGTLEDIPFLHFELCYYQAIEFALSRGLSRVEAGAQGQHKIARGYLPTPVRSAHHIPDPGFRDAIARYLDHERPAIEAEIKALTDEQSPFRKT